MILKIIKCIKEYFYMLWITNPILNPTVVKIQPITRKDANGNKVTKFRLSRRGHALDSWKLVGDFSSFEAAWEIEFKWKIIVSKT